MVVILIAGRGGEASKANVTFHCLTFNKLAHVSSLKLIGRALSGVATSNEHGAVVALTYCALV